MTYYIYLLLIGILFIIDQFSKHLITTNMQLNQEIVIIKNFFNIKYVRNYGAGFSILQNQRILLIVIPILAVIYLLYLLYKENNKHLALIISYILIIAGALGNLYERIVNGYVVDFLDFYIFGYDYPVFNFADSYIVIGFIIIIILTLKENKNAKN